MCLLSEASHQIILTHCGISFIRIDTQRPKFPVQCRTLHPNEFCGAGDVPAEAVDLGQEVLPLEDLAGIAQG